uniref:Alpha/beta hydrolase n=1 Tax=Heterorhabditis bacteriophora TaxID=37862 RepID=A0A1I7WS59_HETBA
MQYGLPVHDCYHRPPATFPALDLTENVTADLATFLRPP